ncbi:MAG TPA: hypothetical protein VF705_08780 [Longimicrobium sp.]|jgi:hypothetical protein
MKKIKLNPELLSVETFGTGTGQPEKGTVRGFETVSSLPDPETRCPLNYCDPDQNPTVNEQTCICN